MRLFISRASALCGRCSHRTALEAEERFVLTGFNSLSGAAMDRIPRWEFNPVSRTEYREPPRFGLIIASPTFPWQGFRLQSPVCVLFRTSFLATGKRFRSQEFCVFCCPVVASDKQYGCDHPKEQLLVFLDKGLRFSHVECENKSFDGSRVCEAAGDHPANSLPKDLGRADQCAANLWPLADLTPTSKPGACGPQFKGASAGDGSGNREVRKLSGNPQPKWCDDLWLRSWYCFGRGKFRRAIERRA